MQNRSWRIRGFLQFFFPVKFPMAVLAESHEKFIRVIPVVAAGDVLFMMNMELLVGRATYNTRKLVAGEYLKPFLLPKWILDLFFVIYHSNIIKDYPLNPSLQDEAQILLKGCSDPPEYALLAILLALVPSHCAPTSGNAAGLGESVQCRTSVRAHPPFRAPLRLDVYRPPLSGSLRLLFYEWRTTSRWWTSSKRNRHQSNV